MIGGSSGFNDEEALAFKDSAKRIFTNADNCHICGKGDYTHSVDGIEQVCSKIGELDMIYVDYLQNMKPASHLRKESRFVQVEDNMCRLNELIGNLNVACVLMCQINREGSNATRPRMHHLKHSSTIENEAHIVSFLHREQNDRMEEQEIYETLWYSDKTRIVKPFATRLAFVAKNAEYTGMRQEVAGNYYG